MLLLTLATWTPFSVSLVVASRKAVACAVQPGVKSPREK
jgi:hypothetical protein